MSEHDKPAIGNDLKITKVERDGAATWISGTVNGHIFWARIYGKHAADPSWELGRSRIAKLELRRSEDSRSVFRWDRGLDSPGKDPLGKEKMTTAIVAFLMTGALDKFGFSHVRDRREFAKARDLKPDIRYEH